MKLGDDIKFSLFKKYVDFGNVCEAATNLFVKLRETPYYGEGVDYMVNSPSVVPTKKYNCMRNTEFLLRNPLKNIKALRRSKTQFSNVLRVSCSLKLVYWPPGI